jgi:hypothetical protein
MIALVHLAGARWQGSAANGRRLLGIVCFFLICLVFGDRHPLLGLPVAQGWRCIDEEARRTFKKIDSRSEPMRLMIIKRKLSMLRFACSCSVCETSHPRNAISTTT